MKINKILFIALLVMSTLGFVACELDADDFKTLKVSHRTPNIDFDIDPADFGKSGESIIYEQAISIDIEAILADNNFDLADMDFIEDFVIGTNVAGVSLDFLSATRISVSSTEDFATEVDIASISDIPAGTTEATLTVANSDGYQAIIGQDTFYLRIYGTSTDQLPTEIVSAYFNFLVVMELSLLGE